MLGFYGKDSGHCILKSGSRILYKQFVVHHCLLYKIINLLLPNFVAGISLMVLKFFACNEQAFC